MKIFEVPVVFEHTATIVVRAKDEAEARALAFDIQFGDHHRKLAEYDGDYGKLLSVDKPKELTQEQFNKEWNEKR